MKLPDTWDPVSSSPPHATGPGPHLLLHRHPEASLLLLWVKPWRPELPGGPFSALHCVWVTAQGPTLKSLRRQRPNTAIYVYFNFVPYAVKCY